jgi:hypothetical protein
MLKYIIILLFVFSAALAGQNEPVLNIQNKIVQINYNSLKPTLLTLRNGLSAAEFHGNKAAGAYIPGPNNPALHSIYHIIAIPEKGQPQIQYTFGDWQEISLSSRLGSAEFMLDSLSKKEFRQALTPSVSLEKKGIRRGVPIAAVHIQPFRYNPQQNSLWYARAINISVHLPIQGGINAVSGQNLPDKSFFTDIINPIHIESCRILPGKKSAAPLSTNWYQPGKEYIRLSTTRDGIALFTGNDLLNMQPGWAGSDISTLYLEHKGNEYPFGIVKDNDGLLSSDDIFLFAGKRAAGDTTWHNYVTEQASFFLSRANAPVNPATCRLSAWPSVRPGDTALYGAEYGTHIEEDHYLYNGDRGPNVGLKFLSCDFNYGKNFFWYRLSSSAGYSIFSDTLIVPSIIPGDSLQIKIGMHGASDIDSLTFEHIHVFRWNGALIKSDSFSGMADRQIILNIPAEMVLPGANHIAIEALPTAGNGVIESWLNYIEVNALRSSVYAPGGQVWLKSNRKNAILPIAGFTKPDFLVLDTIHNTFLQSKASNQGYMIKAGAQTGAGCSIMLNDSILAGPMAKGLYMLSISQQGKMSMQSFDKISGMISAFNEAAPGTLLVFATTMDISQQLSNTEKNDLFATTNIPSAAFVLSFIKGSQARNFSFSGATQAAVLNIFQPFSSGNSFQAYIPLAADLFAGFAADLNAAEKAFVHPVYQSDLRSAERADYLIITHRDFLAQAQKLAAHRGRQGWRSSVICTDDIYKEFGYGYKSVHPIRDFLKYAWNNWQKPAPRYLLIMGNSSWDPRKLLPTSTQNDFVPSYGYPVSDVWFTLLDGDDAESEMIAGRLPVSSVEQADAVVNKLIEYDSLPPAPWQKEFLFLAGGGPDDPTFHDHFNGVQEFTLQSPICGDTTRLRRLNAIGGIDETIAFRIRSAINQGALWTSFSGHGSPQYFELDGWRAADLNNRGKYFLLTTFSCNSGAYGEPSAPCRNEEYVLEAGKGSIASVGNTYAGISNPDYYMFVGMFKYLSVDGLRQIGDLVFRSKQGLGHDDIFLNAAMQFNLIGDPLTRLLLDNAPDYYIRNQDADIEQDNLSADDEYFTLQAMMHNRGTGDGRSVPVLITRTIGSRRDSVWLSTDSLCNSSSFSINFPVAGLAGTHMIRIEIDPNGLITDEKNRTNNALSIPVNIFASGLSMIDPLAGWHLPNNSPLSFRFLLPRNHNASTQYEMELLDNTNPSSPVQLAAYKGGNLNDKTFTVYELHAEWIPGITLSDNGRHLVFRARSNDTSTGQFSNWTVIPCHVQPAPVYKNVQWLNDYHSGWPGSTTKNLIVTNDSTKAWRLGSFPLKLSVQGCSRGKNRYARIRLGEREYIEKNDQSKFNVLRLPPFDSIGVYRDFDAWFAAGEPALRAGNCADLVNYLRDTVQNGDLVAISVSDATFRGSMSTPSGINGDVQSLRQAIRSLGSKYIDSVFESTVYPNGSIFPDAERYEASFVLIGYKGSPAGSAIELYGPPADTLSIDSEIPIYYQNGMLETGIIGPATQWNTLRLGADTISNTSIYTQIIGFSAITGQDTVLMADSSLIFNLDSLNANTFPMIKAKISMQSKQPGKSPALNSINSSFIPSAELALLPSGTQLIPYDNNRAMLRGDSTIFRTAVINLSLRAPSDSQSAVCIGYLPISGSGATQSFIQTIPVLSPNQSLPFTGELRLISTEMSANTRFTAQIDCGRMITDLYRFNNSANNILRFAEDTIAPQLELYADGRLLHNYDYVAAIPAFEILLYDNSNLPLDSSKIRARINRFWQPDSNARQFRFEAMEYGNPIRAKISFVSDGTLDIGENIFSVFAEDASANRDTLRLRLNLTLNAELDSVQNWPNPLQKGNTLTFSYNYKAQKQDALYTVHIAAVNGNTVSILSGNARIGNNLIQWDGRDQNGVPLPPGVYLYRLNLQGDSYSEPAFGKFIILE